MEKEEFNKLTPEQRAEFINKISSNKMPIDQQAEFINSMGGPTAVEKEIGLNNATLRSRLKKEGYERNKKSGFYLLDGNEPAGDNKVAMNNSGQGNTIVGKVETSNRLVEEPKWQDEALIFISDNLEALKEMLESHKDRGVGKEPTKVSLSMQSLPEATETTKKTYRVNSKVAEQLDSFCKCNKAFRVQDLVSLALQEFIEKYT